MAWCRWRGSMASCWPSRMTSLDHRRGQCLGGAVDVLADRVGVLTRLAVDDLLGQAEPGQETSRGFAVLTGQVVPGGPLVRGAPVGEAVGDEDPVGCVVALCAAGRDEELVGGVAHAPVALRGRSRSWT
jgi:hypothetical protein